MRRAASILMGLPALGHLVGYIPATMEHVLDASWPDHARFHAFQSLGLAVGWDVLALWVIAFPFRRGEAWTRWVLLLYLIFVQAGYFASIAAVPSGTPPEMIFNV